MPSPFPGMDPFIESQKWTDFHTRFITALSDALVPSVRPNYVVDVEERVYVERDLDDPVMAIRPDVAVTDAGHEAESATATTAVVAEPVECLIPMPEEMREVFLTIRRRDDKAVITVIELLSPSNKRPGASGFEQYLGKRNQILASNVHLVELDLLRGGRRLPLAGKLPPHDFLVTVARGRRRPRAEVYAWSLKHAMPVIPIPLSDPDPDVPLALQEPFTLVYDRAGYDLLVGLRGAAKTTGGARKHRMDFEYSRTRPQAHRPRTSLTPTSKIILPSINCHIFSICLTPGRIMGGRMMKRECVTL